VILQDKEIILTFGSSEVDYILICEEIIKQHHEKIYAKNKKSGGAVFCFSIPINQNETQT